VQHLAPPPFRGQHLCRWLHASIYSKLLKINGVVECKWDIKNRDSGGIYGFGIDHCWAVTLSSTFWRPSIGYSTSASPVSHYKHTPPRRASANLVYDRKRRRYAEEILKNATYLALWGRLWGTTALPCIVESSRRADVKSQLTYNPATCRFPDIRGKWQLSVSERAQNRSALSLLLTVFAAALTSPVYLPSKGHSRSILRTCQNMISIVYWNATLPPFYRLHIATICGWMPAPQYSTFYS